MLSDFLAHHGIKGQKWGVRRFQNYDGTLTSEGRKRRQYRDNIVRNREHTKDVNEIVSTLTDKEKKLLGASLNEEWIEPDFEDDIIVNKAKTIVQKDGDLPVSFIEIWTNGSNTGQIAIATRNDPKYRGRGLAAKNVEEAIKWTEQYGNKSIKELQWIAEKTNEKSIKLAEEHGFEKDKIQNYDDYVYYTRKNPNYKTKNVFVSGSSKTQDKESGYYREKIPDKVIDAIDEKMKNGDRILVGDAPGIDRQVQDYLKKKKYSNVTVYGTGDNLRYTANKKWDTKLIDSGGHEPGTPEFNRQKDIAMTNDADSGIAVVLENGGAGATRNNARRLIEQNKEVQMFKLKSDYDDDWVEDLIKELSE